MSIRMRVFSYFFNSLVIYGLSCIFMSVKCKFAEHYRTFTHNYSSQIYTYRYIVGAYFVWASGPVLAIQIQINRPNYMYVYISLNHIWLKSNQIKPSSLKLGADIKFRATHIHKGISPPSCHQRWSLTAARMYAFKKSWSRSSFGSHRCHISKARSPPKPALPRLLCLRRLQTSAETHSPV